MLKTSIQTQAQASKSDETRAIIASLYYLSQEAERSGYNDMSKIILNAIGRIQQSIESQGEDFIDIIADSNTVKFLAVMNLVARFPVEQYAQLADILEIAETEYAA